MNIKNTLLRPRVGAGPRGGGDPSGAPGARTLLLEISRSRRKSPTHRWG